MSVFRGLLINVYRCVLFNNLLSSEKIGILNILLIITTHVGYPLLCQ